jgi:hypothetical protein
MLCTGWVSVVAQVAVVAWGLLRSGCYFVLQAGLVLLALGEQAKE